MERVFYKAHMGECKDQIGMGRDKEILPRVYRGLASKQDISGQRYQYNHPEHDYQHYLSTQEPKNRSGTGRVTHYRDERVLLSHIKFPNDYNGPKDIWYTSSCR